MMIIEETVLKIEYIVTSPTIKGGRPRINGTGIRVQDIAMYYHGGWTPERIASELPPLTMAQVYAALSYYFDHQAEIDQTAAMDDEAPQTGIAVSDWLEIVRARQTNPPPAAQS